MACSRTTRDGSTSRASKLCDSFHRHLIHIFISKTAMETTLTTASLISTLLFGLFFVVVGISAMLINFVFALLPIARAPFIPTPSRSLKHILSFAEISRHDRVYDLGSGDGRVVITAAKQYGAAACGIEQNFFLVAWSRLRAHMLGAKSACFVHGNFFNVPLSDADVVFCYLLPGINDRLTDKLSRELKAGALVVSRTFSFPHWIPEAHDTNQRLFRYRMPPRRQS